MSSQTQNLDRSFLLLYTGRHYSYLWSSGRASYDSETATPIGLKFGTQVQELELLRLVLVKIILPLE